MGRKQSQSAEAVWRERLARFQKSDWTVAEFCRREGVSNPSFYQWRKRLRKSGRSSSGARTSGDTKAAPLPAFVPVGIPSAAMAEIEFPNGLRIRLPAANSEALRTVIQIGRELCQEVSEC